MFQYIPRGQTGTQISLLLYVASGKAGVLPYEANSFASWPLKLAELLTSYKSLSYSRQIVSCVPSPPMILAGPTSPF